MADHFFGITDTGKKRDNNEDAFIAETILNEEYVLACVIDGVGGYEGGEIASQIARDIILQQMKAPKGDILMSMRDSFLAANAAIFTEKQLKREIDQMACVVTLAVVDIKNNKFYYAHVGDTRLYLFRDNTLVKISHDHSFVGFLEDSGRLNEDEAMQHPRRNQINKALGFEGNIEAADYVETGESPFLPGDMVLLCSDGLTDMLNRSAIVNVLNSRKSLNEMGKTLVKEANIAGGKDNITVVLVANNKTAVQQTATRPVTNKKKETSLVKEETLDERYVTPLPERVDDRRRGSGAVPLLSVLLILLLGAVGWLAYQYYQNKGQQRPALVATVAKPRNPLEQRIMDSLNNAQRTEVFVLHTAGDPPVTITDSLMVDADSMHIIGNGVVLRADSTYSGPAFVVSPQAKYILLDSMTLENFDIGVLLQNNALVLKNVVFSNCRVPVQYNLGFPSNTPVSSRRFDTGQLVVDTLSNQLVP